MFITVDGPDGVGKTSVSLKLVEMINKQFGYAKAVYTSEPTTSELGTKIREILKTQNKHEVSKLTDYFIQDRAEHIVEIKELLLEGSIVICDRYKYSTVVYQHLQGVSMEMLIKRNNDFLKPDFAFVLNVKSVDTLLAHISSRGSTKDLFETSLILSNAIELYSQMNRFFPDENIRFISAECDIGSVLEAIIKELPVF